MDWTTEQIADLTQLWGEGLTTSEIGRRMGISKCAVVGKAHRLHLASRPSPIKRNGPIAKAARFNGYPKSVADRPRAVKPRTGAKPASVPVVGATALPDPDRVQHYAAMGIQSGRPCQWPVGHPGEPGYHVCGADRVVNKPFCAPHCAVAFVPVRPPKTEQRGGVSNTSKRGFASMDPEKRKAIAAKGGKSVPNERRSFSQNPALAAEAGRIGGLATPSQKRSFFTNRDLAATAGKKGGSAA